MKPVDFYKLPRSIQDRFVGSVVSGFPPAPILAVKGGTRQKEMWLGSSAACLVALVVVARLGYGSLESALSLHSPFALVLYAGLVFGVVHGLVRAYDLLVRERALPFASGVYVFPACVIDARSDQFRVHDASEMTSVDAQGGAVRIALGPAATFTFPVDGDAGRASALVADVQAGRERAARARAEDDPKELVAVDPLHNPRFSSPVGPRVAYAIARPPWGKLGVVVAAVVGVVIGPTLWALRNRGSDTRMHAIARHEDQTAVYRAYLARGSRFKEKIASVDLPRAELHEAIATKDAAALVRFKKEHPSLNPAVAKEMNVAVRAAMLAELEKAKASGSLAALRGFAEQFPGHGVEPELRVAIHAVYARELDAYRARAPQKDKNAAPFVERLFLWAEKNGPKVEIRFRRKVATSLERADKFVSKHPSFAGVVTYPSRFFDDAHAGPREAALAAALVPAFDQGLSPELFDVSVGELVPMADTLPDVKVPTLFITHMVQWSGHSLNSTKPRGVFVGLTFDFDAFFVLPGDPKPYKLTTQIPKPYAPTVLLKQDDPALGPGPAEEKVYGAMANDAFERYAKTLLGAFFPSAK